MTDTLTVSLPGKNRSYPIYFQEISTLPEALDAVGLHSGQALLVTDETVGGHYGDAVAHVLASAAWTLHRITIPPGEESKSIEIFGHVLDQVLRAGISRKTVVIALGGGVVGDLAGFAAATLLRGLPLVHIPTSVIAQVDSAIGGKTGINHATGKNLIGAFYQPRLVLIDPTLLNTLPAREFTSGLAEVLKYAFILDAVFFDWLESHFTALTAQASEVVAYAVRQSAALKARVVSEDETEQGLRAILNFGHTFGHAIEKAAGYGTYTHGEAVALGMIAALHLSHQLTPGFPLDRSVALVRRLPIPHPLSLSTDALLAAMQSDKKKEGSVLRLVVLDQIGNARVTADIAPEAVRASWEFVKSVSRAAFRETKA